ncbi:GtrA family protein [Paenibacillus sp. LHD-38]|uniref:GtrA family protein n=1 Tax=Paenibacillus sp. LHD-38 TaxID=3072143 RepID=UPI00280CB0EC|nr:GtrA family protein [Paenibacillus sp. LHD-38]MDQ8735773.1 GtrA family protein [Paenibacillus sp. LHD-38]
MASKKVFFQFLAFNLVGLLNTAIDFLLFTLLLWLGTYYLIAQIIAYGAGMINSFVLNSRYTFHKRDGLVSKPQQINRGLRFALWNALLLGLTLLLLAAFTEWWGMNEVVSKVIVTVITVALNFYGSKKWVFAVSGSRAKSS